MRTRRCEPVIQLGMQSTSKSSWNKKHEGVGLIVDCPHCGKPFKAKTNGGRNGPTVQKYCSQHCVAEARKVAKRLIHGISLTVNLVRCKTCNKLKPMKGTQSYCSHECKRAYKRQDATRACGMCGVMFSVIGMMGRADIYCSPKCRIEKTRQSPAAKRGRRIAKGKRRAIERGAKAEKIDPIAVFEAAGWVCWLCGQMTDKRLRGTGQPMAPELDHIVPLAKGGSHTLENVACSCRRCNLSKSDTLVV